MYSSCFVAMNCEDNNLLEPSVDMTASKSSSSNTCNWSMFQTRDDFLGLVEIPLEHAHISTERSDRELQSRDFILRPRRYVQ